MATSRAFDFKHSSEVRGDNIESYSYFIRPLWNNMDSWYFFPNLLFVIF